MRCVTNHFSPLTSHAPNGVLGALARAMRSGKPAGIVLDFSGASFHQRLDICRMCPGLAILGSAWIRGSDEWTAGEGRTVAESNLR
jgi:hypothetical protein